MKRRKTSPSVALGRTGSPPRLGTKDQVVILRAAVRSADSEIRKAEGFIASNASGSDHSATNEAVSRARTTIQRLTAATAEARELIKALESQGQAFGTHTNSPAQRIKALPASDQHQAGGGKP